MDRRGEMKTKGEKGRKKNNCKNLSEQRLAQMESENGAWKVFEKLVENGGP